MLSFITAFMGYKASKVEIAYEFAKLLPNTDEASIDYDNFKQQFGLDGNVLVIGIQAEDLYQLKTFNAYYELNAAIKEVAGIQEVVSVARLHTLVKNDSLAQFQFRPLLYQQPKTQETVDSLKQAITQLPFYEGIIYNSETGATLMAITFDKKELNTKHRIAIVNTIKAKVEAFANAYKISVHYSGLPYIRTVIAEKIKNEMLLFMALAVVVTISILFLFFRSFLPVVFSLMVVVVGVVFSFGMIVLFGYKISVLSGLIPPLIIVIGVPNCILLLNKYHIEFSLHQQKERALLQTIEKIGVSLFFANVTTAIGFVVFCSTSSQILIEFGLVAALNVMGTYVISLIVIPIACSFMPPPSTKNTKHIANKHIVKILKTIDYWVQHHRRRIYSIVAVLIIIALIGIFKIKALGYVVDDLPKQDPVYVDMKYFEKNFHGVLPFEVIIDTKHPNGVFSNNGAALYKINNLQKLFATYKEFSKPVSVVQAIKLANQAYRGGNPKHYRLPGAMDLSKIAAYSNQAKEKNKQNTFKAFIDSSKRYTRISIQMADIGSVKMKTLLRDIQPRIDSVLNYNRETNTFLPLAQQYKVTLTGNSLMFLKGNDFLVRNLLESVLLAIVLIALIMFLLFMIPQMVLIAVVPSLIPLLITAGLMGYFNIYLKPSTILIFSIAFGIASDGTLYFLTKYRQEFKQHQRNISKTVSLTIKETGVSMIYTAIILFAGFGIFTASSFGGTAALGILISVTLLMAYLSNLILLPCFLLSFEKRINKKALLKAPLLETIPADI